MSRRFRRVLFYFFVLLFFITTPVVLFYAQGYKYDFEQKKFVETGAFYIKSYPKKAKVFVNNTLLGKSTPVLIKGLLPHRYSIRVEHEQFTSWNKNLEVYPGLVTKAESILLFPTEPKTNLLHEQTIESFYVSPDKERVLFIGLETQPNTQQIKDSELSSSSSTEKGIWIQEFKDNSAAIQLVKRNSDISFIQWSQNSKYFVFYSENQWFLNDIQKPSESTNLTTLLGNDISNVNWSTKDSENLYFLRNSQLFRFEWRSKSTILIAENIAKYQIYNNKIYTVVAPNKFLYETNLNGEDHRQIILSYPDNVTVDTIHVSNSGIVLVKDTNKNLYRINNGLLDLIAQNIHSIEFSQDNKKLLIQKDNEIFMRYLENIESAPNRQKDEEILLTRYADSIKKAYFLPFNYEYVIFEVGNTIKISETDNRDTYNTTDLAFGHSLDISFEDKTLNLYYIDGRGLNLSQIEFN